MKQQSKGKYVTPLGHIILIQIQNPSILLLVNTACLAEKQKVPIFDWTRSGLELTYNVPHSWQARSPLHH